MAFDLWLWIGWIVGLCGTAALIALTWHALFGDKSRGRRRCPRCWHDLSAASKLQCAECGYELKSESALFATRRYYGRAVMWLGVLVGAALYLRIQVTQQGIIAFLPARAVVWLLPIAPVSQGPMGEVQRELIGRLSAGTLKGDALDALVGAIVEGDASAEPCSREWETRYGRVALELIGAASLITEPNDPLVTAVERLRVLPPRIAIEAGRAARVGASLPADLTVDEWWPPTTEVRVRIRDTASGREEIWGLDASVRNRPLALKLAPMAEGETERAIEVGIRNRPTDVTGRPIGDGDWGQERVETLKVPLKNAMALAPLEPVSSAASDELVESVFAQGVVRWESGMRPAAFWFDVQRTGGEEFVDVLFGVEIDLREGDAIRRTLRAWWPGGPRGGGWRAELTYEDLDALKRLPLDGEGWSIRVRGVEDIATRAFVPAPPDAIGATTSSATATKYWAGDLTMPAKVTPRGGEAPRRRWFRPQPEQAGAS